MTGDVPTSPLELVPAPSDRRIAVRLTPDALRQVRAGHPWIYDESIVSVSHRGAPGDLAVVFDEQREFVAIGLYDPGSPIRVKVLHRGRPARIDEAWFAAALSASFERRAVLRDDAATTGYRCVHGENDGLPGIVVDRYDSVLVAKVYSTMWLPHLRSVVTSLEGIASPDAIVLRLSRNTRGEALAGLFDGAVISGALPDDGSGATGRTVVEFLEHGLRFEADVVHGQKTGHFLDQRENRARVGALARDGDVLDVFCSSGGFSVHAAAGGARSVHSIDLNASSIAAARRNVELNRETGAIGATRHETTTADAFEAMGRLVRAGRRFDIVVVDPPSFAPNRASVPRAVVAYARLTELATALVRPGGVLVQASCSSRVGADEFLDIVHRAARGAGHRLVEIERTAHPIDHPVGFAHGAYLKALFATVEPAKGLSA